MKKVTDLYKTDSTALTHAFQDACADSEFLNYVRELNVSDDILMKYT